LEELTADKIRAWKRAYVARAGHDEFSRKRYTTSCNSYLRRARALFSKSKVIDKLRSVKLPAVLPFDGVELERRTDTKFYGCGIDAVTLLRSAVDELANDRVEELKAFLLALTLGLRRREMDLLEWQSFDFVTGTLRIEKYLPNWGTAVARKIPSPYFGRWPGRALRSRHLSGCQKSAF